MIATYHLQRGSPEEALAAVEEGLRSFSDEPELHSLRGRALEALGRLPEALAAHRQAIDLVPASVSVAPAEPPARYHAAVERVRRLLDEERESAP